jgi:hypothetical protein
LDNVSDVVLKENIRAIGNPIEILNQLNPVRFTWKNDDKGVRSYGLIAQEVERILPEIVSLKNNKIKAVSYVQIISLLISAVKIQQEQINTILSKLPSNPQEVEDGNDNNKDT